MREIVLTEREKALRKLLLDVADYVGTQEGCVKPELRITGGWVRDKLLGISSKDIDIGIDNMTGYRFGTLMKQYLDDARRQAKYGEDVLGGLAKIEANPEKSKHLETVTTKILGLEIDLVNLRKEIYVEDSRNPTMEFGTPVEDALRRDATINSLFYNLSSSQVEDLTGQGLRDMELEIIRTPLSPFKTFKDDPLRVLRCIRIASKLGYNIDPQAEQAMSDPDIKNALRLKISRERVGIEVEKMLRGPRPHYALSLLDRLGLYGTIFIDPNQRQTPSVDTSNWKTAYDQLSRIIDSTSGSAPDSMILETIKTILASSNQESYLAWLLCAISPWATVENPAKPKASGKLPPPMAAVVAREGLKADNKSCDVIKDAVLHYRQVIASKDALPRETSTTLPSKRKQEVLSRDILGMSIRQWGANWRSTTMFAMLVEIMGTEKETDRLEILKRYAAWLTHITEMGLLNAFALRPIVDGKQLMHALDAKSGGPWLTVALKIVMEWQLRNPEKREPDLAIAEVVSRRAELGLN